MLGLAGGVPGRVRAQVERSLREMSDIEAIQMEDGNYRLIRGSAVLYLTIEDWGMRDVMVRCTSYVVMGATIDADLLAFLLEANSRIPFGSFAMDEDRDILFEYALIATNSTRYELKEAIKAVAKAVDDYDNKISNRWGGETAYKVLFGVDPD
ncbi:MAG: T3SS (YopN, CesT) and YbjN peptide-binding chaperone 1 [Candidatus Sericytochromatia bacterium]